jgi:uncharacterized protein (TIGR03067 family)
MKPHAPLVGTMGLLFAVAGIGLLTGARSTAEDLKARVTLGTPKKQATFGVGFDTTDCHLALGFSPDEKVLASGSGDTTVKLWSVAAAEKSGTAANASKKAAVQKEKKNLIGTWKLVSCEAEGEEVPETILKVEVVRWRITENSVEWTVEKEQKGEDKYTLDPTTRPKRIDLMDKEGRSTPGIYSLEGDTLKVCMNEGGKERPKEFASQPNTRLSVWVFK